VKKETSFYIRELILIHELKDKFDVLDSEQVKFLLDWLEQQFEIPWGQIDWSKVSQSKSIKISKWENHQLTQYLSSLSLPNKSLNWSIVWSDAECGISIPFQLACDFIGELWYPSKSDIWMIEPEKKVCVEITHESVLSYAILAE